MAITQNIFLNADEIRNNASKIEKYNSEINDCLNGFKAVMGTVEGCWEAQGSEELQRKFDLLVPEFEKFNVYLSKVVRFLNQNVAESAEALDTAIKYNAVGISSRI